MLSVTATLSYYYRTSIVLQCYIPSCRGPHGHDRLSCRDAPLCPVIVRCVICSLTRALAHSHTQSRARTLTHASDLFGWPTIHVSYRYVYLCVSMCICVCIYIYIYIYMYAYSMSFQPVSHQPGPARSSKTRGATTARGWSPRKAPPLSRSLHINNMYRILVIITTINILVITKYKYA